MQIKELQLFTDKLDEQKKFYAEILNLDLIYETDDSITIEAGDTTLIFVRNETAGIYHFAFNIPSFKINEAIDWLKERVKIQQFKDDDIIDFVNWNAYSTYFYDAAGNVLEFIARKNLEIDYEVEFNSGQILNISEFGIPTDKVRRIYDHLHDKFGLKLFWGDFEKFCTVGDEHGLFIIVKEIDKKWFPTSETAYLYPFKMVFETDGKTGRIDSDGKVIIADKL